ncbi:MAG: hypothetical protein M1831_001150 [Alyxoria varia]|nr:MAG: hypothetical protein M1831_001150 [Alyxoria varia]
MSSNALERYLALRAPDEIRTPPSKYQSHLYDSLKQVSKLCSGDSAKFTAEELLEGLNPEEDTVPYAFILSSRVHDSRALGKNNSIPKSLQPGGALWQKLVGFLTTCDRLEARYCGRQWKVLMEMLAKTATLDQSMASSVMMYMSTAILRLDTTASTFTTAHLLFVRHIMATNTAAQAIPILELSINTFPTTSCPTAEAPICSPHTPSSVYMIPFNGFSDPIELSHIQEYYLTGAMIYMELGNWQRAILFLEQVLSTPTVSNPTGMMVEAYKKWVLLNLFVNGKVPQAPSTITPPTLKTMKSVSKAYDVLAEVFEESDPKKLRAEAFEGNDNWHRDGNFGLVHAVAQSHQEQMVQSLENTFTALPVYLVARRLEKSQSETEQYLKDLVSAGTLKASLSCNEDGQKEPVLRFLHSSKGDTASEAEEKQLQAQLTAQIYRLKELGQHISDADRRVAISREVVEYTRKARMKDERGAEDAMDLGHDVQPTDEDDDNEMSLSEIA